MRVNQTTKECFGVLGALDRVHGTCSGFNIALKLGKGTTMGVSRKEVAAAVRAVPRRDASGAGRDGGEQLFEDSVNKQA